MTGPHEQRQEIEDDLAPVMARSMRRFLMEVRTEAVKVALTEPSLTAAGEQRDPLTLGKLSGWWESAVDERVMSAVDRAFRKIYKQVSGGRITATSLDAASAYLARVRDRLVRGIDPPIQQDAFDRVRVATAEAIGDGWSRKQLAARISAELSWETDGPYWRKELARVDHEIDLILDPLGPPGTPARETARLHDARVSSLQVSRARCISRLDAEESYWTVRANRIARTEATGAHGYASVRALSDEGRTSKTWLATGDGRTRLSHAEVSGSTVALDAEFLVGGYRMHIPGDPSAPAAEVVNCRCCIVGGDL
jgi:hypothetical protein